MPMLDKDTLDNLDSDKADAEQGRQRAKLQVRASVYS